MVECENAASKNNIPECKSNPPIIVRGIPHLSTPKPPTWEPRRLASPKANNPMLTIRSLIPVMSRRNGVIYVYRIIYPNIQKKLMDSATEIRGLFSKASSSRIGTGASPSVLPNRLVSLKFHSSISLRQFYSST